MFPFRTLRSTCAVIALLLSCAPAAQAQTRMVRAGDDLQAALNAAQPGETLLLEAGATFRGSFVLPVKPPGPVITVRSSASDSVLPGSGQRIAPEHAPMLARIESTTATPALRTAAGTRNWRLQFLHFPSTHLGYGDIIQIGDGSSAQSQLSQVPSDIELDRVYVHGHPLYGQKRGIALNGRNVTVRNSYVADIKAAGADTQAIGGWNGPGPFTIENNYLEAAGENVMFGGSDPAIPDLVSADITVRHNYMSRPLAWRNPIIPTPGTPSAQAAGAGTLVAGTHTYRVVAYRPIGSGATGRSTASGAASIAVSAGTAVRVSWPAVADATEYRVYATRPGGAQVYWSTAQTSLTDTGSGGTAGAVPTSEGNRWVVKNVFEVKNARRMLIEYNIFENNWLAGQSGYAILFTPRNQDGRCTWCVVEDVIFQYNIVRHSAAGINLIGYDSNFPSRQTRNIVIRHNLFYNLTQGLGGNAWFLLVGDGPRDLVVDHNTIDSDGTTILYVHGGTSSAPRQVEGFRFTNNAARHGLYGINGAHFSWGNEIIARYFPGSVVQGNWLQGGNASRYPATNYFSGTFESAFVNAAAGDYRAAPGGILVGRATDGTNIGADLAGLLAGVQGVVGGHLGIPPTRPANLRVIGR